MTTATTTIPQELRDRPQWFMHIGKCPVNEDQSRASYTNEDYWSDYESIVERLDRGQYDGIGYVFSKDDPFVGVDLDGCRCPITGRLADWATDIIEKLNSYTEISPSGTGVKIFIEGKSPFDKGKKKPVENVEQISDKNPGFEIYDYNRFFTVTGDHLEDTPTTVERSPGLGAICEKYVPKEESPKTVNQSRVSHTEDEKHVIERARKYIARIPGAVSGSGGHDATFHVAGVLVVGVGLSNEDAIQLIEEWNATCEPPWTEAELRHKIDDASKQTGARNELRFSGDYSGNGQHRDNDNGQAESVPTNPSESTSSSAIDPIISNGIESEIQDDKGKTKTIIEPLSMANIISGINEATGGWPRRARERLFVHEGGSTVDLFERPNEFFGWIGTSVGKPPVFYQRPGFHSQSEIFAEFKRMAKTYRHIETLPHWPPYEDHYHTCEIPKPGDGKLFEQLPDRFSPATPLDRDLIKLLFATAFWGGAGGQKPAFLISADCGRGAGKSALVSIVGLLAGGMVDIPCGEDVDSIKKRLLSKDGIVRRLVLLDNLKSHKFSWGEYESLITSPEISGWIMYNGNGSRPNNCLWCITQNGIGLSTDMSQRVVVIQLARPKYEGGWLEYVQNFVIEKRDGIIADIIAFLQADQNPLAKRSRWGAWESAVLSKLSHPNQVQQLIISRQKESDSEQDESSITEDYFREMIESAAYNTETDVVFIPSRLAAEWFNRANGEHAKTATISRMIKQAIREQKFENIQETPERRKVRGFLWVGMKAGVNDPTSFDLETRIEESKRNYPNDRY